MPRRGARPAGRCPIRLCSPGLPCISGDSRSPNHNPLAVRTPDLGARFRPSSASGPDQCSPNVRPGGGEGRRHLVKQSLRPCGLWVYKRNHIPGRCALRSVPRVRLSGACRRSRIRSSAAPETGPVPGPAPNPPPFAMRDRAGACAPSPQPRVQRGLHTRNRPQCFPSADVRYIIT